MSTQARRNVHRNYGRNPSPSRDPGTPLLVDPTQWTLIDASSELVSVSVADDGTWTVELDGATAAAGPDDAGAVVWYAPLVDTFTGRAILPADLGSASLGTSGLSVSVRIVLSGTAPGNDAWVVAGVGDVDGGAIASAPLRAGGAYFPGAGVTEVTLTSDGAQDDSASGDTTLYVAAAELNPLYRPAVQGYASTGIDVADRVGSTVSTDVSFLRGATTLGMLVACGMRTTGANQTLSFRPYISVAFAEPAP